MIDEQRQPVILAAVRTPIARAFAALNTVEVEHLIAPLIKALLQRTGINGQMIDDVIIGNAAGGGGNLARLGALAANLPVEIAGQTIDRQCGSGLEAIVLASRLIQAGAGSIYIAGGAESVSTAPWRVKKPKKPGELPQFFSRAQFSPETIGDPDMGMTAENIAKHYGISRQRQDAFALQSHERAIHAQKAGSYRDEIIPIETPKGLFAADDCPRPNLNLQTLSRLKPVFQKDGTVTAGNSCPINDGACLVIVTSLAQAKVLAATYGLLFIDSAVMGVDPNFAGMGAVGATRKLFEQQSAFNLSNVSVIEFNEAFAAQVLASLDIMQIAPDTINRQGGAIALGHPFGASGAILVTRLFNQMKQIENNSLGLATMGIGGGMGISALFQPYHA